MVYLFNNELNIQLLVQQFNYICAIYILIKLIFRIPKWQFDFLEWT